ncbi:SDR family NAD(P)-dependent oxidoreductase [Nocardia africana]
MPFENKVALVTGGASGIGRATALQLAERGVRVVVTDVDAAGGKDVVASIESAGGTGIFIEADVRDEQAVDSLVGRAIETYGGLHLAFNNAGTAQAYTKTHEMRLETFDSVFSLNVRAVFLCMRAELRHMVEHGGGAIVNTSSGAGLKAVEGMPAYVASKHAVLGLTRNAAIEYVRDGIRVNSVAPATISTPMITSMPQEQQDLYAAAVPLGRLGKPEEVASLVTYLLSEDAAFITGETILVDGGFFQK